VYHYLPLSQETEFNSFMEMSCVRPLTLLVAGGQQLEVCTAKLFRAFQNLNTVILFPFQFKLANGRTTNLSSHLLDA
jgi:hypothetical protein